VTIEFWFRFEYSLLPWVSFVFEKVQTDPKTMTGGVNVGKEMERFRDSYLSVFRLATADRPGSDVKITMLSVALVEDLPDLFSSSKGSKLNVGVGVMIRRLAVDQSLIMAC
jgi:hypothetical protein